MSLLRWSDQYLVGNDLIDRQHRYLFDLINAFHDAFIEQRDRREVLRLLNQLIEYSESHFQDEERVMRESGYPELEQHHAEHARLYERIFALNAKLADRSFNPTYDTIAFLRTWLSDHIIGNDLAIGLHLNSRPQSPTRDGQLEPQG